MEEQNNTTESSGEKALCRNCGKKMAKKGNFCPHCGQKNMDGIEPFRKLLNRFWKSATHLDNHYFVEHFVFLRHRYSAVLLVFAVLLGLQVISTETNWLIGPGWIWAILILPFALKRYYQQNWPLTLLKTSILWIVGVFAMGILFAFGLIVTATIA
jgi:hypothetical protein